MDYNRNTLIPIIPSSEYDNIATEFLERYYDEALRTPMAVPIEKIARNDIGLDVKAIRITEELDVYGITVFADGYIPIYDEDTGLYEDKFFKRKTVLVDSEAYKKTNSGCVHNTLAHECVHWYKHRMYYKMQEYTLPRQAKYCKCKVGDLPYASEEEEIMENQAIGIAPKILMPRRPFVEIAGKMGFGYGIDNGSRINELAAFFEVSKQSVSIRLSECGLA